MTNLKKENLIEQIADLEHQQWIEWSKALAGADEHISEDRLDKWAGLWIPYKKLTEENKEKDRVWARKVLPIIEQALLSQKQEFEKLLDKIEFGKLVYSGSEIYLPQVEIIKEFINKELKKKLLEMK